MCEFCDPNICELPAIAESEYCSAGLTYDKYCGNWYLYCSGEDSASSIANYCPKCGRNLNDFNDAPLRIENTIKVYWNSMVMQGEVKLPENISFGSEIRIKTFRFASDPPLSESIREHVIIIPSVGFKMVCVMNKVENKKHFSMIHFTVRKICNV